MDRFIFIIIVLEISLLSPLPPLSAVSVIFGVDHLTDFWCYLIIIFIFTLINLHSLIISDDEHLFLHVHVDYLFAFCVLFFGVTPGSGQTYSWFLLKSYS